MKPHRSEAAFARLRLFAKGGREVAAVLHAINALHNSYNGFILFTRFVEFVANPKFGPKSAAPVSAEEIVVGGRPIARTQQVRGETETERIFSIIKDHGPEDFVRWVGDDALRLRAVELHSPGHWDFIGRLNPLEVIRQFLQDCHERRKDREYRESAEVERLALENAVRRIELLGKMLDVCKRSAAIKDEETALIFRKAVLDPLAELENAEYFERAELRLMVEKRKLASSVKHVR